MAMSNWLRSLADKTSAPAVPASGFKTCCLASGRYDGINRDDYFQGVKAYAEIPREAFLL